MTSGAPVLFNIAYALVAGATLAYAAHIFKGRRVLGRLGSGLAIAALGFQTLGLAIRTTESGHWPLSNTYEFSLAFLWSLLAVYLVLEYLTGMRAVGVFVLAIAVFIGAYPHFLAPEWMKEMRPLLPALRSGWLVLHVTTGAVAYGAFAVSFAASVMYLLADMAPVVAVRLPPATSIESFNFRALSLGYPWMSLVLITGAIWAQLAWGRYWNWDVKETWTLVTWLVYTVLFHLRSIRGWRGKSIASLSIVGFGFVLFTFLGVAWLAHRVGLQSLHLY